MAFPLLRRHVIDQGKKDVTQVLGQCVVQHLDGIGSRVLGPPFDVLIGLGDVLVGIEKPQQRSKCLWL